MKIKKISNSVGLVGNVTNQYSESTQDSYGCAYINNIVKENIYSTEEVQIGKWIDNKPLYRKVIKHSLQTTISHDISNLKEIVNVKSMAYNRNSGNYFPVPSVRPSFQEYEIGLIINNTNITCEYLSGYPASTVDILVIIEYTKTTDSPSS